MRVLVVEDEASLADAVARGLRRIGMNVDVAYDGDDGYDKALFASYDVLVLDRDLPGRSGDEICQEITTRKATRVLMLTASVSDAARASGFQLGASDYVTKPFSFADLVERVRALGPPETRTSAAERSAVDGNGSSSSSGDPTRPKPYRR
jgi:DNA-binding response OmpR family regulator